MPSPENSSRELIEECHTRCSLSQWPLDKSSVGREDLVYGGDAIDKFGPFVLLVLPDYARVL